MFYFRSITFQKKSEKDIPECQQNSLFEFSSNENLLLVVLLRLLAFLILFFSVTKEY